MKVAVTGAGGFIGGHILEQLEKRRIRAIAVDKDVSGICAMRGCRVVEADISAANNNWCAALCQPDVVIHLAWGGLPNYKSSFHINTELPVQKAFLDGLLMSGLKNLTVAGTCFEYGMADGPLTEVAETAPSNNYAVAKDELRKYLQFKQGESNVNLSWCRLFYMYGERQSEKSIYSQLKQAVARGDKSFPMSGGEQVRDYLPVERVASYMVDLALKQKNFGVVNVCSGRGVRLRDLVSGWISEHSWDIRVNLGVYPYSDYEPMRFWGDDSKLKVCLAS